MDKIIIFGGTGFIGSRLAAHLEKKGMNPVLIARNAPKDQLASPFFQWDAHSPGDWISELNGAKAIVNLSGKSVDCIKTPENCDLILRSRVDSTRAIGRALRDVENPPEIWIQMSTAHIYGDPPSRVCTEDSTIGYGLAPFVGRAWEEEFLTALLPATRGVRLRTSFVMGKGGGALKILQRIVRFGLGGKVGRGSQGMSWIHEYDMHELIYQSIKMDNFEGVYIASAPHPVSNKEFMRMLRKKMGVPVGFPSPEFMTRLGARFIFNTDPELALYGRYVRSERLKAAGFRFRFPSLGEALDDLL